MNFHLTILEANLRGGKDGTFMVGLGRHVALLRHCVHLLLLQGI